MRFSAIAFGVVSFLSLAPAQEQQKVWDVPYVATPDEVVASMLSLAGVHKGDVVYDLGCGDGRIVIAAARLGARGVGIDINPDRIRDARLNAKQAGVEDSVKFIQEDLFKADIKDATVVTLYLLPSVNLKLRPRLWSELKAGTRVVSHSFDMGDWKPEKKEENDGRPVYFWTIPAK